jgi:hypothetical protein
LVLLALIMMRTAAAQIRTDTVDEKNRDATKSDARHGKKRQRLLRSRVDEYGGHGGSCSLHGTFEMGDPIQA